MNFICKCNKDNFFKKKYSYWEEREVTTDELEVINFILNSNDVKFNSILHIGIGNSYFCRKFNQNSTITGITISEKEIDKAKSMNLSNYDFFLYDKYSIEFNVISWSLFFVNLFNACINSTNTSKTESKLSSIILLII